MTMKRQVFDSIRRHSLKCLVDKVAISSSDYRPISGDKSRSRARRSRPNARARIRIGTKKAQTPTRIVSRLILPFGGPGRMRAMEKKPPVFDEEFAHRVIGLPRQRKHHRNEAVDLSQGRAQQGAQPGQTC
jgi:hypothetical protein